MLVRRRPLSEESHHIVSRRQAVRRSKPFCLAWINRLWLFKGDGFTASCQRKKGGLIDETFFVDRNIQ
jgi:hypothetical protein